MDISLDYSDRSHLFVKRRASRLTFACPYRRLDLTVEMRHLHLRPKHLASNWHLPCVSMQLCFRTFVSAFGAGVCVHWDRCGIVHSHSYFLDLDCTSLAKSTSLPDLRLSASWFALTGGGRSKLCIYLVTSHGSRVWRASDTCNTNGVSREVDLGARIRRG